MTLDEFNTTDVANWAAWMAAKPNSPEDYAAEARLFTHRDAHPDLWAAARADKES